MLRERRGPFRKYCGSFPDSFMTRIKHCFDCHRAGDDIGGGGISPKGDLSGR